LSQDAAAGRLSQACDRWIYSACLCFGLDLAEQRASGFRYAYSVYQAEYSRNLLFKVGGQMDRVFNAMVDRTRSRLDVPAVRTLFGAKRRPGNNGTQPSPRLGVVLETPAWDLTVFKVHFGLLTLKGYTKGEHVLRFEAIAHNTKQLRCGKTLDKFGQITASLAGMCDRFCSTLDCVDIGFIPDGTLDQLPLPAQLGASRLGGIDLNQPRIRAALAAVLALAVSPAGFTVADFTARVQVMTGQTGYTTRQAGYDLRKIRAKHLAAKQGATRRYHVPQPGGARHRCHAHPPRPRHRAHPRRCQGPPARPCPHPLGTHRSGLRKDPRRHDCPLPPPGHCNHPGRGVAPHPQRQTIGDHEAVSA